MPIDSENKRRAAIAVHLSSFIHFPVPGTPNTAPNRRHGTGGYRYTSILPAIIPEATYLDPAYSNIMTTAYSAIASAARSNNLLAEYNIALIAARSIKMTP